jgi:hypothetical protein
MKERTKELYEDEYWALVHDDRDNCVTYWLQHVCPVNRTNIARYNDCSPDFGIDEPCLGCGKACPPGLQGLYLAMVML